MDTTKKVLASDIDGTLIFRELEKSYKPEDLKAIQAFQKAGHLFGVCTGRPLCNFDEIRKLNLDFYIVSSGAILLDKDFQIIEEYPITKKLAKTVFDDYKDEAGIIVQTGSNINMYMTFEETTGDHVCIINHFDEIDEDKIYGISLVVDSDKTAMLIKKQLDNKYPELEGFQNKNSIDIVKKGCSKGTAIKRLKQILNSNEMSGIGDSYNDIPLLESADIGFTFHSSPKVIQDKANYIVDGIKQAIDILMKDEVE